SKTSRSRAVGGSSSSTLGPLVSTFFSRAPNRFALPVAVEEFLSHFRQKATSVRVVDHLPRKTRLDGSSAHPCRLPLRLGFSSATVAVLPGCGPTSAATTPLRLTTTMGALEANVDRGPFEELLA